MLHWDDELELTEREQDEARRLIKARFANDIAKANSVLAKIEEEAACPEREKRVDRARAVRDMWLALERDWLALFERKLRRKARGHAVVSLGDMRSALDRVNKILAPSVDHDRAIWPNRPFGDGIDPVLCMTSLPSANRVRLPHGLQFIVRLARRAIARRRFRLGVHVMFDRKWTLQNRSAASRSRSIAAVCAPPSMA